MRWIPFFICACFVLMLQSVVAPHVVIGGVRPDWLLVLVVTFALHVRLPDAAIAAWLIGASADLMTIERAGLISFSYLLVAVAVVSVREYLFRYRAMTQFLLTFGSALAVQLGWLIYRYALYNPAQAVTTSILMDVLGGALYTAIWAPLFHRLVLAMPYAFGLQRPRYSYAGLGRLDKSGV